MKTIKGIIREYKEKPVKYLLFAAGGYITTKMVMYITMHL